jgi:hypothetical protein
VAAIEVNPVSSAKFIPEAVSAFGPFQPQMEIQALGSRAVSE